MEFLLIMGGCALVFGVLYIVLTILSRRRRDSIWNWPTVEGQVAESALSPREPRDGEKRPRTYTPVVTYIYTVEGQPYTSQRRTTAPYPQRTFTELTKAAAVLAAYPAGGAVTVHYNPRAPQFAVLELARPAGYHAELWFGVFNLALGAVTILLYMLL